MNKKNRMLMIIIVILCSIISFIAGRHTRTPGFNPMGQNFPQQMQGQNIPPIQNPNDQQQPMLNSGNQQPPMMSGEIQNTPPTQNP